MPASSDSRSEPSDPDPNSVLVCADLGTGELEALAARFGAQIVRVADGQSIRGSYWGEREAGLLGNQIHVRNDTPVHSALHELCHYVCMPPATRASLNTNAGGDYDEENGVCFLQILLAGSLPSCSQFRMQQDMDAWGYTFRLGSAKAWFEQDAEDARDWLLTRDLIDASFAPAWKLRESV